MMDNPRVQPRSHLFSVRVWEEEIGPNQSEWRGRVQFLNTGETRYFREWEGLVPLLIALLAEAASEAETDPL